MKDDNVKITEWLKRTNENYQEYDKEGNKQQDRPN